MRDAAWLAAPLSVSDTGLSRDYDSPDHLSTYSRDGKRLYVLRDLTPGDDSGF